MHLHSEHLDQKNWNIVTYEMIIVSFPYRGEEPTRRAPPQVPLTEEEEQ